MKKEKGYAIIIVVVAILVTLIMIRMGKKKPGKKPKAKAPVVRVLQVSPANIQAEINATALIEANQTLTLSPEISGRVSWISPKFRNGEVVKKGEVLLRLDSRDAALAVKQNRVNVERAKLNLEQEKARGEIAKEEWTVLGEGGDASDMVLREPQLRVAELNLLSAESALAKAKLTLSRTSVRAPFKATVSSENVSLGQVVSPQSPLARLLELGKMKATVTVPIDQITWIDIPGIASVKKGSSVILTQNIGTGKQIKREGKVTALVGEIDQQTRRAKLNIIIPAVSNNEMPLLPGAFVDANIKGKVVENSVSIPREGISAGMNAWKVTNDSSLVKFNFERLWGTKDHIVVNVLEEGSINLALNLPQAPVSGMKVTPIKVSGGAHE